MGTTKPRLPELWMELKDRTLLASLMEEKRVSARELAKAAGWRSHSYMNRLLSGDASTLHTEPAARIAHRLQVPFNLLFRSRLSGESRQNGQKGRAAS